MHIHEFQQDHLIEILEAQRFSYIIVGAKFKAADLLANDWRWTLNAATMLNQGGILFNIGDVPLANNFTIYDHRILSGEFIVDMQADGMWRATTDGSGFRGLIELTGSDSDADGLPDVLDPSPTDNHNAWDLRAAGRTGRSTRPTT